MKTLKLFCFVVLFSLARNAAGQISPDSSTLYISLGANRISIKDEFESPYTYSGTEFLFYTAHVQLKPRSIQILDFSYSKGKIQPVISPQAKNSLLFLNYSYLVRIQELPARLSVSFGGSLGAMLISTTYLPEIEQPNRYVTGSVSIAVSGKISYYLNKLNRIALDVRVPLIGLAYRPNFVADGKEYFGFNSIVKNAGFSGILEYEHPLGPYFAIMAKYMYSFYTYPFPRPVSLMQNGIAAGVNLKF